jgi:hypothetical protein
MLLFGSGRKSKFLMRVAGFGQAQSMAGVMGISTQAIEIDQFVHINGFGNY